jgi:hypothetical protein
VKTCYVCKTEKHESEFGPNRSRADKLQNYCKQCAKIKQTEWYYGRKHKISLDERNAMLVKANGKCEICAKTIQFEDMIRENKNTSDAAVVDHCHESKKVRGILCGACNTGLGSFKDNPFFLESAVEYLLRTGSA